MTFYSMLFGRNSQSDLLLAVIGFKEVDVERFRDAFAEQDGKEIRVYTRTGGGNRSDYPQVDLYRSPLFLRTEDDDFDSTYASFYFRVPEEFVADVAGLHDIIGHGLRKEFAAHLAITLNREPTDKDKAAAAHDAEAAELKRTSHFMANGHTFVPKDDWAMEAALKLAEANGGKLRSAWGIMPLLITVKTNHQPYPKARENAEYIRRVDVGYDFAWKIDEPYWEHCQKTFGDKYPVTMAEIAEQAQAYRQRAA